MTRHRIVTIAILTLYALTGSPLKSVAQPRIPAKGDSAVSEKRFPQLTIDDLQGEPRALAEDILKISSVGLAGPYNPMLRSPQLAERLFRLLDYLRFNTSLPRRLNEFAILIQARLWTSQVEWYTHYPLAITGWTVGSRGHRPQGGTPSAIDAGR